MNPNFKSFVSFCNMSFKVAVTCRSVPLAFDLNVKCTKTCLVVAPGVEVVLHLSVHVF